MAQQTGSQQETVADALARRVEARRGRASRWAEAFRELGAVDRALYETVARTPTAELDEPVRRLSDAANYSRLWLGIAATIALVGGGRGRRAALEGVVAIGVTSATVNLGVKPLARRRRPDPRRTRAVPGPPGTDAGIDLVPLWACRVGVRVRLRRRPAPAGAGPADPAACGWGGLLAGPHRRALSGRRGARRHPRSRNRGHGGSGIRPPPPATAATAPPPPVAARNS